MPIQHDLYAPYILVRKKPRATADVWLSFASRLPAPLMPMPLSVRHAAAKYLPLCSLRQ